MGDGNSLLSEAQALHLLRRTGFGGPRRDRDLEKIVGISRQEAVDEMLDYKPSRFMPRGKTTIDAHNRWIKFMIRARRPIQEKLVLFWHDHLATNDDTVNDVKEMGLQNRTLRLHGKGVPQKKGLRGSLKDFAKAINLDPAMMCMLDTRVNRKEAPNENYARELMEIFWLGVLDEADNPNYTEDDIKQIARAFTGWRVNSKDQPYFDGGNGVDGGNCGSGSSGAGRHDYLACYPSRGPKVVFTQTGGFGPSGRDIAENGEGAAEIDTVIDILFDHTDSDGENTVARHITRLAFEFFGYRGVATSVIDEIVVSSSFDTSFDMRDMLSALFVHDEFYATMSAPSGGGPKSVKWPVDFAVGALRLLKMKPKGKDQRIQGGSFGQIRTILRDMGQELFEPPSVFGWEVEDGWLSSSALLGRYQFARDVSAARLRGGTSLKVDRLIDLSLTNPGDIVDAVTDVLRVTDQYTGAERQALMDYLGLGPINLLDEGTQNVKLRGLFALVIQSPAFQLH